MKNKFRKIDFISVLLIIILFIVLLCYAQLSIFNHEYINCAGFTVFHVITGSMAGTIEINDIVIEKITNEVDVDNIITYRSKTNDEVNFITHRIIDSKEDKWITKGDANNDQDDPVNKEDVVGKVIYIIHTSVWAKVLKDPKVIVASIIALALLGYLLKK